MTEDIIRMTRTTEVILRHLLNDPSAEYYGLEIMDATGLSSGTTYPLLIRLERIGWLESWEEQVDPRAEGRAPRRFYRFTREGVERARISLAKTTASRFGLKKFGSPIPKGAAT